MKFRKNFLVKAPLRLGEDVFTKENINYINFIWLKSALQSLWLLPKVHNVSRYKAFATSAMREAKNSQIIIERNI